MSKTYGFVVFGDKAHCEKVFSYFNDPFKLQNCPTKNSNGIDIGISYGYDICDLKDSKWFSVVFRNLPLYWSQDILDNLCRNYIGADSIYYSLPMTNINDMVCSVVVISDLDSAEKLCIILNKKELENGYRVKVRNLVDSYLFRYICIPGRVRKEKIWRKATFQNSSENKQSLLNLSQII